MKLRPMSEVAEAIRYLNSEGYSFTEIVQAVHDHKMSVVEIAKAIVELRIRDGNPEETLGPIGGFEKW